MIQRTFGACDENDWIRSCDKCYKQQCPYRIDQPKKFESTKHGG